MYTMNIKNTTTEYAYAKINLGLDIIGKRSDGYHLLRMVMQTLSLHDTVTVSVGGDNEGITTVTDSDKVSDDHHNLAFRAADLLRDKFHISKGIGIKIEKRIPVAAGLAGGSSDAAAVLRGVNRLFDLKLSNGELMELGLKLGADVPYCIEGGTKLSEGIGEILSTVDPVPARLPVLLIKPDRSVSTKEVYEAYDRTEGEYHPDIDGIISSLKKGDIPLLGEKIGNVLEPVTIGMVPEIKEIKDFLRSKGIRGVLMSGSGPTVYAVDSNDEILKEAYGEGKKLFPAAEMILTETYSP